MGSMFPRYYGGFGSTGPYNCECVCVCVCVCVSICTYVYLYIYVLIEYYQVLMPLSSLW